MSEPKRFPDFIDDYLKISERVRKLEIGASIPPFAFGLRADGAAYYIGASPGVVEPATAGMALGPASHTYSNFSVAIGVLSEAGDLSASPAVAIGYQAKARGDASVAIGTLALAPASMGYAFGHLAEVDVAHHGAMALGLLASTGRPSSVAIGINREVGVEVWNDDTVDFPPSGAIHVGLRGKTLELAPNTRGIDVAVAAAAASKDVAFPDANHPDDTYAVFVTPSWDTTVRVTDKAVGGFTIRFGSAPAGAETLDWLVVR